MVDTLADRPDTRPVGGCAWCWTVARLTSCEHQGLCPACVEAYLHEATGEWIARLFGERYRNARGADLPVTARARNRGLTNDEWLSTFTRKDTGR